jgi:hypothetical protein
MQYSGFHFYDSVSSWWCISLNFQMELLNTIHSTWSSPKCVLKLPRCQTFLFLPKHETLYLAKILISCLGYSGVRVMLHSKLDFHRHVDYLRSQALKLLRLIHFIICKFSSLDSLKILFITLIFSELAYTCPYLSRFL